MNHYNHRRTSVRCAACVIVAAVVAGGFATNASAVTIDWVTVGNAGNAADPFNSGSIPGIGAVGYEYRISKYEVTNAQYTEFLNAVDPTGANALGLFNINMVSTGGIALQAGNADAGKYVAKPGHGNNPVNWVSWLDSARFTNWLHSGQPTGGGGTETGAYTINNGLTETRAPGANYFLPSENEWYKAAYHKNDGVSGNYWVYPTSTDAEPYSDQPPGSGAPDPSNTGNFYEEDGIANGYDDGYAVSGSTTSSTNPFTDVGAYTSAASPYGTFDQGGNVMEWIEAVSSSRFRGLRGGAWDFLSSDLRADHRANGSPAFDDDIIGFRVASPVGAPSPGPFEKVKVDYDTPDVVGPISFGLTELPAAPNAKFSLGDGTPAAGGATAYGLPDVLSASMIFGDGIFTTLTAFNLEVAADGSLVAMSYAFAPQDTPTVEGSIVLNFPLTITGTDIASGQAFTYTYPNRTVILIPSGDLNLDGFVGIDDLNIVLGNWNQNVPPADPAADPSGDNFIGIEDLNVVLGNWNAGIPPLDILANVPEPGSAIALGLLGLTTYTRNRYGYASARQDPNTVSPI